MKFSAAAITTAFALVLSSSTTEAFTASSSSVSTNTLRSSAFVPRSLSATSNNNKMSEHVDKKLKMDMKFTVGIVGATGAVGSEIRGCLENRKFPVEKLRIFGSKRSAGTVQKTAFGDVTVELFDEAKARECDVCFLAVDGDFAKEHAKNLVAGDDGCIVIDNSSAFRYDKDIPLVVPEINGQETKKGKLIANPNCTTAIGLMALWPLHKAFTLKKIIMSTYQAASGAGQPGMDELKEGTKAWLNGDKVENKIFAYPLPFNVIPHIDKFQENGYTKEEMKVTWESRKICGLADDFPVSCTAVRIPTIRAHSETIIIETEKPVDLDLARKVLSEQSGVKLVDDTSKLEYPMPSTATGQYDVEVGRLRKSLVFGDHGMELFVCGDQLLRGAALNAVIIAEEMAKNGVLKPKVAA